jgi:hypothetical protein
MATNEEMETKSFETIFTPLDHSSKATSISKIITHQEVEVETKALGTYQHCSHGYVCQVIAMARMSTQWQWPILPINQCSCHPDEYLITQNILSKGCR